MKGVSSNSVFAHKLEEIDLILEDRAEVKSYAWNICQ